MIESVWQEFDKFTTNSMEKHCSHLHGLRVQQTFGSQQLDELNKLNPQNCNSIGSNEFSEYLALDFQSRFPISHVTPTRLQSFIAYIYHQDLDIFSSLLNDLITTQAIEAFISGAPAPINKNPIDIQNEKEVVKEIEYLGKQPNQNDPDKKDDEKTSKGMNSDDSERKLKKERFQQLVKESEQLTDPISFLFQLQQKYIHLSFENEEQMSQGNTFISVYKSSALGIKEVRSDPKPRKKEAQNSAAKKFWPHLMYYLQFSVPFFESEAEELLYLKNIQKEESKKEQEGEYDIMADLLLGMQYKEEIVYVQQYVARYEKNNGVNNLKVQFQDTYDGAFKCIVRFLQNDEEVFSTEGRGSSKKMAKEIAFIKISPLIIKHYDPDYEAKEVEQPTAPKKQYSRRGNTTVPCDPPDEY